MIKKILLYCTKSKPYLYHFTPYRFARLPFEKPTLDLFVTSKDYPLQGSFTAKPVNGTVIGECEYEVEEVCSEKLDTGVGYEPIFYTETLDDVSKETCLMQFEIENYLGCKAGGEVVGYATHIKNLHIFEEPKQLSDYYAIKDAGGGLLITTPLTRAPQNMMRVSVSDWEYGFVNNADIRILMSIRPEWLCLIGNRVKTVDLRKVILRGMLPND